MVKKRKRRVRKEIKLLSIVILLIVALLAFKNSDIYNASKNYTYEKYGWNLILVNDELAVPKNYESELLKLDNGEYVDTRIYPKLQEMFNDARNNGLHLFVREGYRSFEKQEETMDFYINNYLAEGKDLESAKELALKYVAKPGHSEHELGLAVDINADTRYISSDEVYTWLNQNSYKYGFIKRYEIDKVDITGINNEPWHYRYVGVEDATKMYELNYCLEEYIEYLDEMN